MKQFPHRGLVPIRFFCVIGQKHDLDYDEAPVEADFWPMFELEKCLKSVYQFGVGYKCENNASKDGEKGEEQVLLGFC